MDFTNFLFHCSNLGLIMTDSREKSNLDKYNDLVERHNSWVDKLEKIESDISKMNQATKGFSNKMTTLENYAKKADLLAQQINILEPIKDVKQLSETCRAHLSDIFVIYKYERTKDVKLKYWEKGLMNEEESIDIYSFATNTYFEKNKVRKSNSHLTGEIDFQSGEFLLVYDMKTSWNIFSFWKSLAKGVTDMEWWQMQGYLWLWDMEKAKVCKILTNTPDKLIENEKKDLLRDFIGSVAEYEQACLEIEKLHRYDDIPVEEKIIELVVERDDDAIARIAPRIEECRDYLNNIKPGAYFEK